MLQFVLKLHISPTTTLCTNLIGERNCSGKIKSTYYIIEKRTSKAKFRPIKVLSFRVLNVNYKECSVVLRCPHDKKYQINRWEVFKTQNLIRTFRVQIQTCSQGSGGHLRLLFLSWRVKKTFWLIDIWCERVHFFQTCDPPKEILATGLRNWSWLILYL